MRDSHEEFKARGAEVAAIGMGEVEDAREFADEYEIPFPLLVDKERLSYRAMEIPRGSMLDVLGPGNWLPGVAAVARGHTLGIAKQDVQQLGGAVVIAEGGEMLLVHRASRPSDNLPVEQLLEALP